MPVACSALALAISDTMLATPVIEATMSLSCSPARLTRSTPSLHLAGPVVDQVLDVLRGLRRALREAAHLRGDHRETAAGVAGARGLDRGVQRQEVGLPRDLVDHADDVGDLPRGFLDPRHRRRPPAPPPRRRGLPPRGCWRPTGWPAGRSRRSSSRSRRSPPSRPRSAPGSRPAPRCAATGRWCRRRFRTRRPRLRPRPP